MRRYLLFVALFVLFLVEGTIVQWVLPASWQSSVMVTPHPVFVGVLLISLFQGRHQGLAYGLGFGLLQDFIYYGHALGVYSFSMGLVGYVFGLVFRSSAGGIVIGLIAAMLGSFAYDSLVHGIYLVFLRVVHLDYQWTFLHQILPSLLINGLVALLLYIPMRRLVEFVNVDRESEEK